MSANKQVYCENDTVKEFLDSVTQKHNITNVEIIVYDNNCSSLIDFASQDNLIIVLQKPMKREAHNVLILPNDSSVYLKVKQLDNLPGNDPFWDVLPYDPAYEKFIEAFIRLCRKEE